MAPMHINGDKKTELEWQFGIHALGWAPPTTKEQEMKNMTKFLMKHGRSWINDPIRIIDQFLAARDANGYPSQEFMHMIETSLRTWRANDGEKISLDKIMGLGSIGRGKRTPQTQKNLANRDHILCVDIALLVAGDYSTEDAMEIVLNKFNNLGYASSIKDTSQSLAFETLRKIYNEWPYKEITINGYKAAFDSQSFEELKTWKNMESESVVGNKMGIS